MSRAADPDDPAKTVKLPAMTQVDLRPKGAADQGGPAACCHATHCLWFPCMAFHAWCGFQISIEWASAVYPEQQDGRH